MIVVPDEDVEGLKLSEQHLIVDTKEETTFELEQKIESELKHLLVVDENGETYDENYRVSVRGTVIEEQNTMTAMMATICLYTVSYTHLDVYKRQILLCLLSFQQSYSL